MYLSVSFVFKPVDGIVVDHKHSKKKMMNEALVEKVRAQSETALLTGHVDIKVMLSTYNNKTQ